MNKYYIYIAAGFLLAAAFISCFDEDSKDANRITMTTTFEGKLGVYLIGTGRAEINWGDGNSRAIALVKPDDFLAIYEREYQHTYTSANAKTITITGDNITGLMTGWGEAATDLDVSHCPSLKYLNCNYEQLSTLDISKNTALVELYCIDNQLIKLDVSKNTALQALGCHNNQLTTLDLSNNTEIIELNCKDNQLTLLDFSKNTQLKYLYCGNNQLTAIDVSKCNELIILSCNANLLPSLDLSKNVALHSLYCQDNKLNAEALNTLFGDLPDRAETTMGGVDVRDNPGVAEAEYNPTIATVKNWSVID
ncbi:MAG: hypothetical protein FWH23_04540 [Bacteroidales bacterium]|nr:hypothetical protein [Bacteroidales bacterium]MCL2133247.1 hypothetical protein [Bacteroidales bacterium]